MIVYKVLRKTKNGKRCSAIDGPLSITYSIKKRIEGHSKTPLFAFTCLRNAKRFLNNQMAGTYEIWKCEAHESNMEVPEFILEPCGSSVSDAVRFWGSKKKLGILVPPHGTKLVDWIKLMEVVYVRSL